MLLTPTLPVSIWMLPAWWAVELPEKVQTVRLVSPWRGLMVRTSCAWLCSTETKESAERTKAAKRADLLPMPDARCPMPDARILTNPAP